MHDVWINGVSLRGVDDRVRISKITEQSPRRRTAEEAMPFGGRYITQNVPDGLTVSVTVGVYAPKIQERMTVIHKLAAWARDGELRVSYRPAERLTVSLETLPQITSNNWAEDLTFVFRTVHVPCWEAASPSKSTLTGDDEDGALAVTGDMDGAAVDVTVTNTSGETMNELVLECAGTRLEFAGLGVESGKTLIISHDRNGILSVKSDEASKLGKRTAASDDDLIARFGANTIRLEADTEVTATFSARGLWR